MALLSGAFTSLAFPKFNLSFFGWISLIPLLFILLEKKPKQSFLLGWLAGFTYYALLLYWIPYVPAHYGNLSLGFSFVIYIFLVLFLGLLWAFFSLLLTKLYRSFPKIVFLLIPFLWVSMEYILTYAFTGFPWCLLGYSQYRNIYFIQLASITGVYGLSFFLVLLQSMFIFSIKFRKRYPFFVALGLILCIHLGGLLSLKEISPDKTTFKASVIQGNVSSDIYWDQISTQEISELFNKHLELSRNSLERGAELIIWPEFSVPLCFSCPEGIYVNFKEKLFKFVKDTSCTLVLGTNETNITEEKTSYYNTAICLGPGQSANHYYKMHLVPFGEYTPYKKIFFFIEKMTHAIGDITPGNEHILHQFKTLTFGSPICYEIIFPNLVRKFSKIGANFIVTITNDGWYGKSSAPYQHFSMAVLRAIENRRYLLRAATTGISGIIDPYGRILSQSELMTQTFILGDITPSTKKSIYTQLGDVLPLVSLTLTIIFFILAVIKRKK
ncbi:MAG: apolipoprotein N-acyltransferase [Candidatus Aminicenantaceae bacterium]